MTLLLALTVAARFGSTAPAQGALPEVTRPAGIEIDLAASFPSVVSVMSRSTRMPTAEFLDILDIGEALAAMRCKGYDTAIGLFTEVRDRTPDGPLTPKAIYWRGIVAYFRDGKSPGSANAEWGELVERFPDSIWAKRVP
ncbi:MAG: hypothetical protein M3457_20555 [Chloroflexota bacterium]|nr:hypothetical protein [Chloroflexota bacterium]